MRISDWSSDVCSSDLVGPFWSHLRKWTYPHAYGLITMTRGAMNYFPPQMRKRQWVIPNPAHLPEEARPYRAEGRTMAAVGRRSEEHTSELQSLMRISYAVFCLKKKNKNI